MKPRYYLFFYLSLIILLACSRQSVHTPAAAGIFYTSNSAILSKQLDKMLYEATAFPITDHKIVGLFVPYANYSLSGPVAAKAYKLLIGKHYDVVIILCTNNFRNLTGVSIFPKGVYKTLVGNVPIASDIAGPIISSLDFATYMPKIHEREYSVEMQLHFLKKVLGSFSVVPILIGQLDEGKIEKLADTTANKIKDKNALIIIASNLSAYPDAKTATNIDLETLKTIATLDNNAFAQHQETVLNKRIPHLLSIASAPEAIETGILLLKKLGVSGGKILSYSNSYEVTGDDRKVLGYGSIGFFIE